MVEPPRASLNQVLCHRPAHMRGAERRAVEDISRSFRRCLAQAGEMLDQRLEIECGPVRAHVLVHVFRYAVLVQGYFGAVSLSGQREPHHRVDAGLPVGETPGLRDTRTRDELDLAALQPLIEQCEVSTRRPTALARLAGSVTEFRAVGE